MEKVKLPKGWSYKKLGDVLDFVIGGDWGKDPSYEDSAYGLAYCIRGSEIKNWSSQKGNTASLRKIKLNNIQKRKLQDGDILVEISGGGPEQPVGRTVLIDNTVLAFNPDIPKICTNFLRLMRPSDEFEPKFLNLYLNLFYYSGEIVKYQGGSNNLRNLKYPDFAKIEIPWAPKDIQKSIVTKIEELFSEIDKGIEDLKLAQQQLKVHRQSVLKWAFEGKLTNEVEEGKLPEGWLVMALGAICQTTSGGTPNRKNSEYYNGKIPWVKSGELSRGTIYVTEETITESGIKNSSAKIFPKGTLLIALYGATIGKLAFLGVDAATNQAICGIYENEKIDSVYLFYFLTYRKKDLVNQALGGAQPNISQTILKKLEVPLPPVNEQRKIVLDIESRLSVADKMEESIADSLKKAEALKMIVLRKAFRGGLI